MESIVRSFRVSQVLWKSGHWAICSWPYEAPCIVIQPTKKAWVQHFLHPPTMAWADWYTTWCPSQTFEGRYLLCNNYWQKFASNHFDIWWNNPHHAPGLHFKSRQRKVMQEDLATILIKVWINFSTKFIVTSTLFDTVPAIFEIKEFILYTLWYSDERLNFCHRSKLM